MMSANSQIKSILELIQHKLDVGSSANHVTIRLSDIEMYPDYESILDKLDWQLSAISVSKVPNEKGLDDASLELAEMEHSAREFSEYMSYEIEVLPDFSQIYREHLEINEKGVRKIDTNEIKLTYAHYDSHIGVLTLSPYHVVEIAQRGKTKTTMDVKTKQCNLMEKLFRDEKHLREGISLQYAIGVNSVQKISNDEMKQVKNTLTQINNKFTETTNLKRLVIIRKNKVLINPVYLL